MKATEIIPYHLIYRRLLEADLADKCRGSLLKEKERGDTKNLASPLGNELPLTKLLLQLPGPVTPVRRHVQLATLGTVVVVTLAAIASAYASSVTKGSLKVYVYIRCVFCAGFAIAIVKLIASQCFGKG